MSSLTPMQWFQWLSATFVAGITLAVSQTTYVHTTFSKIEDLQQAKTELRQARQRDVDLIIKRIDVLENKLDRLIERGQR